MGAEENPSSILLGLRSAEGLTSHTVGGNQPGQATKVNGEIQHTQLPDLSFRGDWHGSESFFQVLYSVQAPVHKGWFSLLKYIILCI